MTLTIVYFYEDSLSEVANKLYENNIFFFVNNFLPNNNNIIIINIIIRAATIKKIQLVNVRLKIKHCTSNIRKISFKDLLKNFFTY